MGNAKDNPADGPAPQQKLTPSDTAASLSLIKKGADLSTAPVLPENIPSETRKKDSEDGRQEEGLQSRAKARLRQVDSHLATDENLKTARHSTRRGRKRSDPSKDLPVDHSDILGQLEATRKIATTPNTSDRGYVRQKQAGKLWVYERIEKLLVPGSFTEIGSATGTSKWRLDSLNPRREHLDEFIPSNNPQGFGIVSTPTGRRKIYLTADNYALRAGHADGSVGARSSYGEELALRLKIPVVKLVDGSSGGGSVSTIKTLGYSYLPPSLLLRVAAKQLNMGIPNLGAALGPAIGLGAARLVSTHFNVMAADIGSLFNAGPKVVESATFEEGLTISDLGGSAVHCTNGTFDNVAPNEEGCLEQIRTVLGYLPDCGALQSPPVCECSDPVNREDITLRSVISRQANRMYNPRTIITSVVDRGSFFEIGSLWGRTAICGLARFGGRPVGIISLNCEVNGGALDAAGAQKLTKHIKLCDVMNLPIVQLLDVPGYAIGTVAERNATMKWGVGLAMVYYSTTTPIFSVVTRRCYGIAGAVMVDNREPNMRVAWPSAQWGSLPLDGGIEVGHQWELKQIEKQEGPEAKVRRYKELEDEYLRLMNPVRSANAFSIEEIIDPKDTRNVLCSWTELMYGAVMEERLSDRKAGRIHPHFS